MMGNCLLLANMLVVATETIEQFPTITNSNERSYQGKSLSWWLNSVKTTRNEKVQIESLHALASFDSPKEISRVTPVLIECLKSSRLNVRRKAINCICILGPRVKSTVPALIEILKDRSQETCFVAATALGEIGPASREAVPILLERLLDPLGHARSTAVFALGRIGPVNNSVIPAIIGRLYDTAPTVREDAAKALGTPLYHKHAKVVVPALLNSLQQEDFKYSRLAAIKSLGQIGLSNQKVAIALINALKDEEKLIRFWAAKYLGSTPFHSWAKHSVPALIPLLEDPDQGVQSVTTAVFGQLGPKARKAIPFLQKKLANKSSKVIANSVYALSRIDRSLKDLKPTCLRLLRDPIPAARLYALRALKNLGHPQSEICTSLLELINTKSFIVQGEAVRELGTLSTERKKVIPVLLNLLNGEDDYLSSCACSALESAGDHSKEVVAALLDVAQKENEITYENALSALGQMGPVAKAAVPLLIKWYKHDDKAIRLPAQKALRLIAPEISKKLEGK